MTMFLKKFIGDIYIVPIFLFSANSFAIAFVGTYKQIPTKGDFGKCPSEISIVEEKGQRDLSLYRISSNDESMNCIQKVGFKIPGRSGGSIVGTIHETGSYVEQCVSGAWDIRLVNQKLEKRNDYAGYTFKAFAAENQNYVENRAFHRDSSQQTGVSLSSLNSNGPSLIKIETWGKEALVFSDVQFDLRSICTFEKISSQSERQFPRKGILSLDFLEYLF